MTKYLNFNLAQFNASEYEYLKKEKAKIRLIGVQILSFVLLFFLPIMTPADFNHIDISFGRIKLLEYIGYLIVTLIFSGILWYLSRFVRVQEHKFIKFSNKIFFLNVFLFCQVNIVVNTISVYFGSDLLGVIYSPCIFATAFLLSRKNRLWFLTVYFVVVMAILLFLIPLSSFQLFDKAITLLATFIIFYIVGDFILYYWHYEKKQLLENKKIIEELAVKNSQQQDTFDALTKTFDKFVNVDSPNNKSENIEIRTKSLIDEFNLTQQLFKETITKYEDIFENVNDGIVILDANGNIIDINKAGREILEIEAQEHLNLANLVIEEDKAKSAKYIKKLISEGQYKGYEGRIITPNGNIKYIEVSSTAIIKDGAFVGSRDIIRDISQRKNAEDEILNARNAEKQFLANMSHEIRTPLNAIIGMSHLLFDTNPSADQIEYLNIIKNSSNFLLSLISDILDMAKIEAGKMELNVKNLDLWGLLRTVEKTISLKLEKNPVEFRANFNQNLKGVWMGDELILTQILYNLLSNAEKFTEKGFIELNVREVSADGEIRNVQFCVKDSGIGMAQEKLELIFEKFTQIHEKNTQKQKGTGLGLALCKQFVEMQHGIITAHSEPNVGTEICFTVPLKKISDTFVEIKQSAKKGKQVNFEKCRLLVAEDNKLNRIFVEKVIEKIGLKFDFAFDGKETVEKAHQIKYDLILMDLEMPVLDGMEATIAIRNTQNLNHNTPIIALTASAMRSIKEEAMKIGMNGFLTKPFTPDQLKEVIDEFLEAI